MNFSYENQGNQTYLVAELPLDRALDSMTLGMITNNAIPGLAQAYFMQVDTVRYVKYNINGRISMQQLFASPLNRQRVLRVFTGICDALINAEDYMLDVNSILYDPGKIFIQINTMEVSLICVPVIGVSQESDSAKLLFKNMMFSAQFDMFENNNYVGKIINYLNGGVFSVEEFKALLRQLDGPEHGAGVSNLQNMTPVQEAHREEQALPTENNKAAFAQDVLPDTKLQHQIIQPSVPIKAVQPSVPMGSAPAGNIPPVSQMMEGKSKKGFHLFGGKGNKEPKAEKQKNDKKDNKGGRNGFPDVSVPGMMPMPGNGVSTQQKAAPVVPTQMTAPTQSALAAKSQPAFTPRQMPQGQAANFGETTVLGAGSLGETTVLVAGQGTVPMAAPHLIRVKNNEKISLNKPVFRVGKERSYVDYFIGDNTAISRSHANFITRDGVYFVVDTNSTNHTFVNGMMVQSNVEMQISHGDKIRLANEDFEFKVY